jgi:hypothetical protein
VARNVARNFPATGGMTDMDRVLEVQLLNELGEIVRLGVHVVAVPWLARASVTAAIVCNAAVTVRGQEEHLVFERIAGQWPAVAEDYWLSLSPVPVIELRAVFRGDRAHVVVSFPF